MCVSAVGTALRMHTLALTFPVATAVAVAFTVAVAACDSWRSQRCAAAEP